MRQLEQLEAQLDTAPTLVHRALDSISSTSLRGDNGNSFYRTGEYFGGGNPNVPVLVCIDGSKHTNEKFLLTVKSGNNILENGYNTLYLQEQVFSGGNISYASDVIIVGVDIDSTQTQGDVVVKHGTLTFDSNEKTIIESGFRCEKGARLTIK